MYFFHIIISCVNMADNGGNDRKNAVLPKIDRGKITVKCKMCNHKVSNLKKYALYREKTEYSKMTNRKGRKLSTKFDKE